METDGMGHHRLRNIILAVAMVMGCSLYPAKAVDSSFYRDPRLSTNTGQALMWLAGNFEFHKSTIDPTVMIALSSTGGVRVAFGVVATTVTANLYTMGAVDFGVWMSTISQAVAAGGSGSIGGAGAAVFDGGTSVRITTFSFPGATITYGATASTVTYMPVIFATYTLLSAATNTIYVSLQSTGVRLSNFMDAVNSTMTAISISTSLLQYNAWTAINSTYTAFQVHASTTQQKFAAIATDTTTILTALNNISHVYSDEGTALIGGNVTRVDCAGAAIGCSQSAGTVTVSVPGIGFRSVLSTNVATTVGADTPHPIIISTQSIQAGTTIYVSSATALIFNSSTANIVTVNFSSAVGGVIRVSDAQIGGVNMEVYMATVTQAIAASGGGGGTQTGFRSVFSTNAVTNSNGGDTVHPFIISTNSLQSGTTIYTSSGTINIFYSTSANTSILTASTANVVVLNFSSATGNTLQLAPGATSLPSLYWPGSRQAGIYSSGGGSIRTTAGGTDSLNWDSNALSFLIVARAANGTAAAPEYSFTNGIGYGMYADGGPVAAHKMSAGTSELQGWWGTGQVSIGKWGGALTGTAYPPPAVLYVGTSAASNIPAFAVGTGTVVNPQILFQVDGSTIWANRTIKASSGMEFIGNFGIIQSSGVQIGNVQLTTYMSTVTLAIAAAGGGTGGADNFGSHAATRPVNMGNFAILNSSQIIIGDTTGFSLISITSLAASSELSWLSVSTGFASPVVDLRISSWMVGASTYIFSPSSGNNITSLVVGSTSQWQQGGLAGTSLFSYFLRMGDNIRAPTSTNLSAGSNVKYLFTHNAAITRMILKNTAGESEWGQTSNGGFIGSVDNLNFAIRVGEGDRVLFDSNGNANIFGGILGGSAGGTVTQGAKFQFFAGSESITGAGAGLQVGTSFFAVSRGGEVGIGTATAVELNNGKYLMVVGSAGVSSGGYTMSITSDGYVNLQSSTNIHALSSCGATPTILGGGNAFTVTPGAATNACTITFAHAFRKTPVAVLSERSMSVVNALSYTVTNVGMVVSQTSLGTFDVILAGGD